MSNELKLIEQDKPAPVVLAGGAVTPMHLLQVAMQSGADLDRLEKLMALQSQWEANEARKAFVLALSKFKANPPEVHKNKKVEYGNTKYSHATLDEVSVNIGRGLAEYGLSHRWDVVQREKEIIVTCILTHSQGHSERVEMSALADSSGSKNSIQAIGSTVTYLQRYTLLAVTGMAVKGQDNDGKGADEIGGNQLADWDIAIAECSDLDALSEIGKVIATACEKAKDVETYEEFKKKVAARRAVLKAAK